MVAFCCFTKLPASLKSILVALLLTVVSTISLTILFKNQYQSNPAHLFTAKALGSQTTNPVPLPPQAYITSTCQTMLRSQVNYLTTLTISQLVQYYRESFGRSQTEEIVNANSYQWQTEEGKTLEVVVIEQPEDKERVLVKVTLSN